MSEQKQMLADAVIRLFRDAGDVSASAECDGWRSALWSQVEELGLPLVLVPEEQNGVGGDWEDVLAVLHPVGYYGIPLPIGEAMLATKLASDAGLELPQGVSTIAAEVEGRLSRNGDGHVFSGTLKSVPWGRDASSVIAVTSFEGAPHLVLLPRAAAGRIREARNLAGEPRDDLHFDNAPVQAAAVNSVDALNLFERCALLRVAQITGALEAALHRSIEYAKERKQFGRAIGQFQAVQQQLALFGSDAAAVACAARAACQAATRGAASFQIAAAKLRANQAIGLATGTAHQVHAAIGFTHEYALRHATQRLWSWRSEFGNDRLWADRIGGAIAARGADNFWADLTERDDAAA
jgi:acyl-CoA dehydrogenase